MTDLTLVSTSNLTGAYLHEFRGDPLTAVSIAFIPIEIAVAGLRFASRRISKIPHGLDDWLIYPALIFCLGCCALGIVRVKLAGVGRHTAALKVLEPRKLVNFAITTPPVELLYVFAFTLPRLSILGIYLRIFTTRANRIAVYITGSLVIASWVMATVLVFAKCIPFKYMWDKSIPGGHCVDVHKVYQWITLPNIITDVMILLLPIPTIWRLQMPGIKKVGLTVTFLTGSVGLAAGIARFYIFSQPDAFADVTWNSVELNIWTIVEPGMYLMAACFPTYRPLFSYLFGGNGPLSSVARRLHYGHSGDGSSATAKAAEFNEMQHADSSRTLKSSPQHGYTAERKQVPAGFRRLDSGEDEGYDSKAFAAQIPVDLTALPLGVDEWTRDPEAGEVGVALSRDRATNESW